MNFVKLRKPVGYFTGHQLIFPYKSIYEYVGFYEVYSAFSDINCA